MSGEAPRKGKGGHFARRNAKRKARREAAAEGGSPASVSGWEAQAEAQHDSKKPRKEVDAKLGGKWSLSSDGSGSFMLEAPSCPAFEEYYKAQGILPESEWEDFMSSLKTKLPTTFRLVTIQGLHNDLRHELSGPLQCTPEQNAAGGPDSYMYTEPYTGQSFAIPPPQPLVWYPHGLGWYIRAGKSELKTRGNKFEQFRKFLLHHNEQGNINRQEAVSMIPPLLLDVQPHHRVLDMCAAPGSKTAQLLESLHGGVNADSFTTPGGMVIANDADPKRAYLLVHQLKRYGSPAFLVTTHEGQQFPNLYEQEDTDGKDAAAAATPAAASSPPVSEGVAAAMANPISTLFDTRVVQFDRILCDVPCSGDGTLRKNINLWTMFHPKFANGLHHLQIMITCRAIEMLKVGGLIVYSTCSFNPIENEAVVVELLRRGQGNIELLDVSDKLPGLKRRPGMSTWRVRDTFEERWADVTEESIQNGSHKLLKKSMFPPTPEEVEKFRPERCVRVVPHDQDTGGFFIALLRKTGETPYLKNPAAAAAAAAAAASGAEAAPAASPDPTASPDPAASAALSELPDLDASPEVDLSELPPGLDDPADSNSHKAARKMKQKKEKEGGKEGGGGKEKAFNEDPFVPLDEVTVERIVEFYGLREPATADRAEHRLDHSNFFTRSDAQRKCYFVAPAIARILSCARNAQRLKVVHTGSRCYERGSKAEDANFPCQYRIVQEGVQSVLPYMSKQIMYPTFASAVTLLYKHTWSYTNMEREGRDAQLWEQLKQQKNGCVVLVLRGEEVEKHVPSRAPPALASGSSGAAPSPAPSRRSIPLCVWKTPHSLALMLSPPETEALRLLLDPERALEPEDLKAKRIAKEEAARLKEEERKSKFMEKQAAAKTEPTAAAETAAKTEQAAPAAAASTPAADAAAPTAEPAKAEPKAESAKMEE